MDRCLAARVPRPSNYGSVDTSPPIWQLALLAALLTSPVPVHGQILVDTIGLTDRDRQVYGPAMRYIVNDTLTGVHAVWKDGSGSIRYNFRPRHGGWLWEDGTLVSSDNRNLGCLDVEPPRGYALVGADYIFQGTPHISHLWNTPEQPGFFAEWDMGSGFRHNLVATTRLGWSRFAALRNDSIYYRTSFSYKNLGEIGPFPGHSIVSSKQSNRLAVVWRVSAGPQAGCLYVRESPTGGSHWYPGVNLSDSFPGFLARCRLGGCAVYDSACLHLVAGFYDGQDPNRAQLWHYAPCDTPTWNQVHESVLPGTSAVGDEALACCRPSIGRRPGSRQFYVVWEQFDPGNVDPQTGLCRADIWACCSYDRTQPWSTPVRLTIPDATSKRFPFLAEVVDDTMHIICFADRVAGFWEQGQGPRTANAVLYVRVPADYLFAAPCGEPGKTEPPQRIRLSSSITSAGFIVHNPDRVPLRLLDCSGRRIVDFAADEVISVPGSPLPAGIYFVRPTDDRCFGPALRLLKSR